MTYEHKVINEKRSFTEYTVSSPTQSFAIGFELYEDEQNIHLTLNNTPISDLGYTFAVINSLTVEVTPAIPSGVLRIQRETDIDENKHKFSAGAIFNALSMDENFAQIRNSQQETRDGFSNLSDRVVPLVDGLEEALTQASAASQAAQEAATAAEEAAQVTRSASQVIDSSGLTQQDINDHIVNIKEFGGNSTDFDPSTAESTAKAIANPNALPYIGARQTALPMHTLKVWNYCDGYLDRGAVASIRNVASFDSAEPRTEILGIGDASGLGQYSDRDVVGLYVQAEGQPALHTSTATSFTATTVTCSDMSTIVKNSLRKNQIIDVLDGAVKYSGLISSVSNDTITIDTAWYKTGGGTGTPTNGSQVKLVPNTKVWATNFNVMLKPESDAESMVGIELGTFNNKYPNGAGYGYDIWSGGLYRIGAAFQARGQYTTGLYLYDKCDTGTIVSNPNVGHLVIGEGRADTYGVLSHRMAVSFLSRGATTYGYAQVTESGDFLTGINPDGAWQSLKYTSAVINSPATIDQNAVVVFINPNAEGMVVNLPTPSNNPRRVIYAKNLSSTNTVYLGGAVESNTGSYHLLVKETVQLFCDGNTWFPISKHTW